LDKIFNNKRIFKIVSNELKERLAQVLDLEEVLKNQIGETLIKYFTLDKISLALKQPMN